MQKNGTKFSTEGPGLKIMQQEKEFEERLQREIAAKNRAEEDREIRDQKLSKERTRKAAEENLRIMRLKEKQKDDVKSESMRLKSKFEMDSKLFHDEQQRDGEAKKLRAAQVNMALQQQMEEKQKKMNDDRNGLSSREAELNRVSEIHSYP